jgi:uncharacterized coiled-coil protein SlyX
VRPDGEGEPHLQWSGHVQHVQGDEENNFTEVAEAIMFMQQHLIQMTAETLAGGKNMNQSKVILESFKLWERLAVSYMEVMFHAMEQGLKQTDAFTERLNDMRERVLNTWRLPSPPDNQADVLELLDELQDQVQTLAERVKILEEALQKTDQKVNGSQR